MTRLDILAQTELGAELVAVAGRVSRIAREILPVVIPKPRIMAQRVLATMLLLHLRPQLLLIPVPLTMALEDVK